MTRRKHSSARGRAKRVADEDQTRAAPDDGRSSISHQAPLLERMANDPNAPLLSSRQLHGLQATRGNQHVQRLMSAACERGGRQSAEIRSFQTARGAALWLGESSSAIAAPEIGVAPLVQRRTAKAKGDKPANLPRAWAEELFVLYAIDEPKHTIARIGAAYTRDWVRSPRGKAAIEEVIIGKLDWKVQQGLWDHLEWFLSFLNGGVKKDGTEMPANPHAESKRWLLEAVQVRLRPAHGKAEKEEAERRYRVVVREPEDGMGCMAACYEGALEALYPGEARAIRQEVYHRAEQKGAPLVEKAKRRGVTDPEELERIRQIPNTVDLIMETLRSKGKAGARVTTPYDQVEATVLRMANPKFPGWYVFGFSVAAGYHTVILVLDTTSGSPQLFWMDQHTRGFTNDVTGCLADEIKSRFPRRYRRRMSIWQLLPTPAVAVPVE